MKDYEIAIITILSVAFTIAIIIQSYYLSLQKPTIPTPKPAHRSTGTSSTSATTSSSYTSSSSVTTSCTGFSFPYSETVTITTPDGTFTSYPFNHRELIWVQNPYYLTNVLYPENPGYMDWVFFSPYIYESSPYIPVTRWTLDLQGNLFSDDGIYYLPTLLKTVNGFNLVDLTMNLIFSDHNTYTLGFCPRNLVKSNLYVSMNLE